MIKDKFQIELQSALAELQHNLQDLESAHHQIENAKSAASSVINGIDELRTKYGIHLDEIQEQVLKFIEISDHRFRQNLDEGVSQMKQASKEIIQIHQESKLDTQSQVGEVVSEAKKFKEQYELGLQNILDRFLKFLDTTSKRFQSDAENGARTIKNTAHELIELNTNQTNKQQAFIESALSNIRELRNRYADHLNILGEQTNLFLSEAEKKLNITLEGGKQQLKEVSDQIRVDQLKQQNNNQSLLTELKIHHEAKLLEISAKVEDQILLMVSNANKSIEKASSQMNAHSVQIDDIYTGQNDKITKYLQRFEELLNGVQHLENRINQIDFPVYFSSMEDKMGQTISSNTQINQQILDLESRFKESSGIQETKIDRQLDNQKKLIQLLIGLLVLSGIIVLGLILLLLQ